MPGRVYTPPEVKSYSFSLGLVHRVFLNDTDVIKQKSETNSYGIISIKALDSTLATVQRVFEARPLLRGISDSITRGDLVLFTFIGKKTYYIVSLISFVYLIFFVYSSYELYKAGLILTLFLLLICGFSDIGGYVIGKIIGGKKLTKISPNKTISGSIGSFLFSIIPIFLYNFYDGNEYPIITLVVLLSLQISLICQIGDLLISYFKRKAKVKDTGSILPGHGGILDRIDGIVFGLPFGLLLLLIR